MGHSDRQQALRVSRLEKGLCARCGVVPHRPDCTSCADCARQNMAYRPRVAQPDRVTAAYAREEFVHLVPYRVRFSDIASRLGVSADRLRKAVRGHVTLSCCDACGQVFKGQVSLCSDACRTARLKA